MSMAYRHKRRCISPHIGYVVDEDGVGRREVGDRCGGSSFVVTGAAVDRAAPVAPVSSEGSRANEPGEEEREEPRGVVRCGGGEAKTRESIEEPEARNRVGLVPVAQDDGEGRWTWLGYTAKLLAASTSVARHSRDNSTIFVVDSSTVAAVTGTVGGVPFKDAAGIEVHHASVEDATPAELLKIFTFTFGD